MDSKPVSRTTNARRVAYCMRDAKDGARVIGETQPPMFTPVLAGPIFSITRRREMLECKIHLDVFTSH